MCAAWFGMFGHIEHLGILLSGDHGPTIWEDRHEVIEMLIDCVYQGSF